MRAITASVRGVVGLLCAATVLIQAGCTSPLQRSREEALREQVIASNRHYVQAVSKASVVRVARPPSEIEPKLIEQDRLDELEDAGWPRAYEGVALPLGRDLSGDADRELIGLSLRRCLHLTAQNNLDVELARIRPAIRQTQVTQAQAAFDAVFFLTYEKQVLDTTRPPSGIAAFGGTQSETESLSTGLRKPLTSGGQVSVSTELTREWQDPTLLSVPSYWNPSITLSLAQPLLRNFGTDVNRAQIRLAQSARASEREGLRAQLMQRLAEAEQRYWQLYFTQQQLLIARRLLDRTITDRDRIKERGEYDASDVEITEAFSVLAQRRADLLRAQAQVDSASDALKRVVNSPDLPLMDDALIVPLDRPVRVPLTYNLLDAVTTALRRRPELQQSLLGIRDASIRQAVADNQRLPRLDASLAVRFNGSGADIGDGYDQISDAEFIDYIFGLEFEMPVGNRAAEGLYMQRQLEREAAVVDYRNNVRSVLVDIKDVLRTVVTNYELMGATRDARLAAQDNLRALEARERAGDALTPDFLDRKLDAQGRVANAEIAEVSALTDYNIAIAAFYQSIGTLLEVNGIEMAAPERP